MYAIPPVEGQGLGLGALWRIVRRHMLLVILFVVVTLAAVVAYSLWMTPVYQVTSLLSVDEKRPPVPDVYESLSMQENAVSTEMQVLQSRTLAEDVVRDFALQVHLTSPRRVPRATLLGHPVVTDDAPASTYRLTRRVDGQFAVEDHRTGRSLGVVTPGASVHLPGVTFVLQSVAANWSRIDVSASGRAEEVVQFRRLLKVDRPVRDANVLSVDYRGTDPALMCDVLNALTARFIANRQQVQKGEARSAVVFLREQIGTLSRQLSAAEDSLRVYREQERIVRLDDEAQTEVSRFVSAQADRNTLDAERAALAQLVHAADSASTTGGHDISHYRRLVASPSLLKNPAASGLLQSLSALEDQRSALRVRRTPQDPELQALTARIDAIDDEIRTMAVTYLDGLSKQIAAIDQTLGAYGTQLQHIPQREVEYARLERSTKVLSDAFMLLQTRLKDAEIAQAVDDPSVRVVDAAVLPDRPLRPNLPLNLAAGFILGVVLGIGAAVTRHAIDRSVRTRADIRLTTGLPVIGLIPSVETVKHVTRRARTHRRSRAHRLGAASHVMPSVLSGADHADAVTSSVLSDAYARLDANIAQLSTNKVGGTLLVTSPTAGDGKTTSAMNLALTLAKRGRRVLLVDADLRNSGLDTMLGEVTTGGLADYLLGGVSDDLAIRPLRRTAALVLDYIPAGRRQADPATLLGSAQFRTFLDRMTARYEVVILDTPPLIVPDAVILSQMVDGVLVVVRAGETARAALGYAVQQLRVVGAPVLGAVLNDIDFHRDNMYDEAFGYYGAAYAYSSAAFDGHSAKQS